MIRNVGELQYPIIIKPAHLSLKQWVAIINGVLNGLVDSAYLKRRNKNDRGMDGVSTCSIWQKQRNMSEAQRRGEQPHP